LYNFHIKKILFKKLIKFHFYTHQMEETMKNRVRGIEYI
jgi:hypothetical protein